MKIVELTCSKCNIKFLSIIQDIIEKKIKNAEGEGFEPPVPFSTSVFKTDAINRTRPTF